jgi:Carboxypeptidase regulatory-like domain
MKKRFLACSVLALTVLVMTSAVRAQRDKPEDEIGPTSWLNFLVLKDDNGKPVRNAAVIMHPVSLKGKQEQGGMELKTDADGKCDFNGIPYGMLRVQVLAQGFQTYGQDFNIDKPKMGLTIKLKRPQHQYSIYDNPSASTNPATKPDSSSDPKKQN